MYKRQEQDRFGLALDSYNAFANFITGCNNTILTKTGDDTFELTMNNEHTVNSVDKVLALTGNESIATFCEFWANKVDYDVWYVGIRLFSSERALFYTSFPHDLKAVSYTHLDVYKRQDMTSTTVSAAAIPTPVSPAAKLCVILSICMANSRFGAVSIDFSTVLY